MTKFLYCLFLGSLLFFSIRNNVSAQTSECYVHSYDLFIKINIIKKPTCKQDGEIAIGLAGKDLNKADTVVTNPPIIRRVFQGKNADGTPKRITLTTLKYGEFEVEYANVIIDGGQRTLCAKGFMSYDMVVGEISGKVCPNETKASFIVKGIGGSGKYTYIVQGIPNSTGIFDSSIPVTADGKYNVSIQDAECPTKMRIDTVVTINDYSSNQIKITGDSTLCPGATLNLTASMANLPAGSTFAWTKAGTQLSSTANLTIPNLTTANDGVYQVAISIPGCSQKATRSITVKVATPAAPTITNKAICLGASAIDFTTLAIPTSSNYTIRWYKELTGGSFETTPPTNNYPTTAPNTFTWYVTQYEPKLNCETPVRTSVSVEVKDIPANISANNIKVYGASLDNMQIIINAKAGFTYQLYWATTGGVILVPEVKNTGTVDKDMLLSDGTGLVDGFKVSDYYVQTISDIGCSPEKRQDFNVAPAPLITGATDICEGSNIKLTAEAITGSKYKWTDPKDVTLTVTNNVLDNITSVKEQHSGLFKVAITTPFGVLNDKINVVVKRIDLPTAAVISYAYCQDATNATKLSATALAGHTLLWYAPGSTAGVTDAPAPSTATAGTVTYGVSQKDASGCESKQLKITVVVKPPADISQLIVQACIAAKPEIVIKGSEVGKKYRVVNAANDSVSAWVQGKGTTSIRINTDLDVNTATTYRVIVRSDATCDASVSVPIIPLNEMILQTSTSTVCTGETITLNAYVFSGATYTWKLPNGSTRSGNPLVITPADNSHTGDYYLTISQPSTASSDICNIVAFPFKVTVGKPLAPIATISYQYCKGDVATTLTAQASSGNSLQWYDQAGNKIGTAPTPSTTVVGTETYWVTQYVSGSPTCESPKTAISINTAKINELADFDNQSVCENSKPRIGVENSLVGVDYTLYNQSGKVLDKKAGNGEWLYLESGESIATTTSYTVGMSSTAVCVNPVKKSIQFLVTTLYIKPDKAKGYKRGVRYELELETNAMSKPYNFSYTGDLPFGFTFSSLGIIEGTAPTTGSSEAKTFTVHIENPSSGCSVEKTYTLETDLLIPQAFSPNGDGVNDYFLLSFHVIIFDRQGVIIHEGHNGWDGTNKGKVMPSGTYFYKVNYINDQGEAKTAFGYVMIL